MKTLMSQVKQKKGLLCYPVTRLSWRLPDREFGRKCAQISLCSQCGVPQ